MGILFSCLLSLLLAASICQASSVSRAFSKSAAGPGETIQVNLTVSITGGEGYYAIDEMYPSGWTVTSTSGYTNETGHIKFVVLQGAASGNQTYRITSPFTPGNYTFSGTYMFENMTSPASISGQSQVQVSSSCVNSTFYRDSDSDGYGNASWSILNCTSPAGYVSNSLDCNDGNPSIHPGASETCGNGVDEDCSGSDLSCSSPPSGNGGGGGGGGGTPSECTSGEMRQCSLTYRGYCASGNESCVNGKWAGCPKPLNETCNKADDDCDGIADENLTCMCYEGESRPCGSKIGECREGVRLCLNSIWDTTCVGEKKPTTEVCNQKDDDCDGTADVGCYNESSFPPCPDGEILPDGCICEEKLYTRGQCFSGKYYEGPVIRDYTYPAIGAASLLLLLIGLAIWRHRREKARASSAMLPKAL
jgi:hypothetical protein